MPDADDVRAPDEQRDAGEQVEQRLHDATMPFRLRPRESAASMIANAASSSSSAMTSGGDERQHVALADLERQPVREAVVHHLLGLAPRRRAVARELDAEQQADAAHVGDQRMAALRASRIRSSARAPSVARALEQPLALDHLERRERRGAADRALLVRVVAERAVGGDVEVAPRDERGHREHARRPVPCRARPCPERCRSARTRTSGRCGRGDRHLVEDQQRAVAVAGVADDPVVVGRRNLHVGAAHGLDDHRGDVLFLAEHVVEVLGAVRVARAAAAEAARAAGRRAARARCRAAAGPCPCGTPPRRRSRSRRATRRGSCPTATASCGGRSRGARASAPCRSRACRRARTAPCRAGRARAPRASPRDRRPPALVKRRGENGSVSSCRLTAAITCGWR